MCGKINMFLVLGIWQLGNRDEGCSSNTPILAISLGTAEWSSGLRRGLASDEARVQILVGARSVSVCEKSFGLWEVFRFARSVSELWELVVWVIGLFEFLCYCKPTHFEFFFEDMKNDCYLLKMQIHKSESADLFHLKLQQFL